MSDLTDLVRHRGEDVARFLRQELQKAKDPGQLTHRILREGVLHHFELDPASVTKEGRNDLKALVGTVWEESPEKPTPRAALATVTNDPQGASKNQASAKKEKPAQPPALDEEEHVASGADATSGGPGSDSEVASEGGSSSSDVDSPEPVRKASPGKRKEKAPKRSVKTSKSKTALRQNRVQFLRSCVWRCRLRPNYKQLFTEDMSDREKEAILTQKLRDFGVEGRITLQNCETAYHKHQDKLDFEELDQSLIIDDTSSEESEDAVDSAREKAETTEGEDGSEHEHGGNSVAESGSQQRKRRGRSLARDESDSEFALSEGSGSSSEDGSDTQEAGNIGVKSKKAKAWMSSSSEDEE